MSLYYAANERNFLFEVKLKLNFQNEKIDFNFYIFIVNFAKKKKKEN